MNFGTTRALVRALGSFVTIPGAISVAGALAAVGVYWLEHSINWAGPDVIPGIFIVPVETARTVMMATATAAMSALVTVYSIVLLVYTMAASSIGPRLLQRFRDDRINMIAVGCLGATFLYCLIGLWLIREQSPVHLTAVVALILAMLSVLLLLYFVKTVSARVTIDQEAAAIAASFADQIDGALGYNAPLRSDQVVLPSDGERQVLAGRSGYVDTIGGATLAGEAAASGATVVYAVRPGDFLMEGEVLATVFGDPDGLLDKAVGAAAPLIAARDPNGDLRFAVNLLVEIGLRALSPGVNDTFTAINCVDQLSASLSRARAQGLSVGVFPDAEGAVRVVFPTVDADVLFAEALPPLRRAARGNGLMTHALIGALSRMALAAPPDQRAPQITELRRLREDLQGCGLSESDLDDLAALIDDAIARCGGDVPDERS